MTNTPRQTIEINKILNVYMYIYRLDVGNGKEINHDRCPRLRLQQQCIKYLGPVCSHTHAHHFYYML